MNKVCGERRYSGDSGIRYRLKAGVLYGKTNEEVLARITRPFIDKRKRIWIGKEEESWYTDVQAIADASKSAGDVRNKKYVLCDHMGQERMVGTPNYAKGEDPVEAGWPLCRMPRVDHVKIWIDAEEYCLQMQEGYTYVLRDEVRREILWISHRGIQGGWSVESEWELPPHLICGLFLFCKYMEQENEFVMV